MTERDDDRLEAFFTAARATTPEPSQDLLARVLADAAEVSLGGGARLLPPPARASRLRQAFEAMGGWTAAGGLVAASAAGLWIGLAPPDGVATMTAALFGVEEGYDLFDEIDSFMTEVTLDG